MNNFVLTCWIIKIQIILIREHNDRVTKNKHWLNVEDGNFRVCSTYGYNQILYRKEYAIVIILKLIIFIFLKIKRCWINFKIVSMSERLFLNFEY